MGEYQSAVRAAASASAEPEDLEDELRSASAELEKRLHRYEHSSDAQQVVLAKSKLQDILDDAMLDLLDACLPTGMTTRKGSMRLATGMATCS